MSHWDEYFVQAGRSLLEEVCWLRGWEGQGLVGVGTQGNKSSGMGGDSSCYLIPVSELGGRTLSA